MAFWTYSNYPIMRINYKTGFWMKNEVVIQIVKCALSLRVNFRNNGTTRHTL